MQEFQDIKILHKTHRGCSWKYTTSQKENAVAHYLSHGQSYARTIRNLGYPNDKILRKWVEEYAPTTRNVRQISIHYTK